MRKAALRVVVPLVEGMKIINIQTSLSFALPFPPCASCGLNPVKSQRAGDLVVCPLQASPQGTPQGREYGWWIWKAKERCATGRKSLRSKISWLFLYIYFTSDHSLICSLLTLKAFPVLSVGAYLLAAVLCIWNALSVSFCLKSGILIWNPLSVPPICAERLGPEALLILRAPFSLLDS